MPPTNRTPCSYDKGSPPYARQRFCYSELKDASVPRISESIAATVPVLLAPTANTALSTSTLPQSRLATNPTGTRPKFQSSLSLGAGARDQKSAPSSARQWRYRLLQPRQSKSTVALPPSGMEPQSGENEVSKPGDPLSHANTSSQKPRMRRIFEVLFRFTPAVDVAASVAKAVPVMGAPVEGALEALVKVLKIVEQHYDNQDDIQELLERLDKVQVSLSEAPAGCTITQRLTSRMDHAQRTLNNLVSSRRSGSQIAAAIRTCSRNVDSYLLEFTALKQAETSKHILLILERCTQSSDQFQKMQAYLSQAIDGHSLRIATTTALGGITIIDPFGGKHEFAKLPDNIELVAKRIQQRYSHNSELYGTLDGFIGTHPSLYEITLDDSRDIQGLSCQQLVTLNPGTTIVISVVKVVTVEDNGGLLSGVSCSWCRAWIELSEEDRSTKRRVSCIQCYNRAYASFGDAVVVIFGSGRSHLPQRLRHESQGRISGMLRNVAVKLAIHPVQILFPDVHTLIIDTAIIRCFGHQHIEIFPVVPSDHLIEIGHLERITTERGTGYDISGSDAAPCDLEGQSDSPSENSLKPQWFNEDTPDGPCTTVINLSMDLRGSRGLALPVADLLPATQGYMHSLPMLSPAERARAMQGSLEFDQDWPTEYFPSVKNLFCRQFIVIRDNQFLGTPELLATGQSSRENVGKGANLVPEWEGVKGNPVTALRQSTACDAILAFPWTERIVIGELTIVMENEQPESHP